MIQTAVGEPSLRSCFHPPTVVQTLNAFSWVLLIMLFAEKPGMIGRAHRTRELYGQVTEVHLAFESKPVFADNLLD